MGIIYLEKKLRKFEGGWVYFYHLMQFLKQTHILLVAQIVLLEMVELFKWLITDFLVIEKEFQ